MAFISSSSGTRPRTTPHGFFPLPGRILGRRIVAGFLVLPFFALVSCSEPADPIAVDGVWEIVGTYGSERWTISDSRITYESDWSGSGFSTTYSAEIVDYSNDGLNAGETLLTAGSTASAANPGFAVMRYTDVDGPGTGEAGKYNIFRWADSPGDAATRDFVQGYKNAGDAWPDNVNGVFDTGAAAEAGATNAAGYFSFASSGAARQD